MATVPSSKFNSAVRHAKILALRTFYSSIIFRQLNYPLSQALLFVQGFSYGSSKGLKLEVSDGMASSELCNA